MTRIGGMLNLKKINIISKVKKAKMVKILDVVKSRNADESISRKV